MSRVAGDAGLRLLVIDDHVPYPELGVGYPRAHGMLHALRAMGHAITLAPTEPGEDRPEAMARVLPPGVAVVPGLTPDRLHRFLDSRTGDFDLLLVSRPNNLRAVLSARPPRWQSVPILYDAEALWAQRAVLQHAVQGRPLAGPAAERLLQDEADLARAAAHVMAVNDAEAAVFRSRGCASVSVVSQGFAARPTPQAWADRADLLFVGALDDEPSPNVDALGWFVHEVMPLLQARLGRPCTLRVAGRCAAPGARALAGPQVQLLGLVPDLSALYGSARVFIAPHRYAAGIPTKVLEAASRGLPCVCSELLARQLNWSHGVEVLTARTAADFADAILQLDDDPLRWRQVRDGALAALSLRFSPAQFEADLAGAISLAMRNGAPMPAHRPEAGRGWRWLARAVQRRLRNSWQAWRISRSPAFDRDWYLRLNPDVAAAGANPALHYLLHGAAEGRDPGPGFSTQGYLSRHPDAASSGLNPLLHFQDLGAARGYTTGPREQGAPGRPGAPHVVFICGEPDTRGLGLRVTHLAQAMAPHGATTETLTLAQAARQPARVSGAAVLVLWRTAWDDGVAGIVRAARQGGACVVFDADDLVIEPTLARVAVIDGIRSQQLDERAVRDYFARTLRAFEAADWACASTEELASAMRRRGKPTFVLPNGFSDDGHRRSRLAMRRRRAAPDDGLVRIGYAAGTRTHQRDFALVAPALAALLRQRSQGRLVLFKDPHGQPLLDSREFGCLDAVSAQIEWRDFVAPAQLPDELARFDINIAPVETGNPFCEAKSELKFVDAALVGVCTVASPTGPFARAIEHGRTGFLAADGEAGDAWLPLLLRLVDDPALRQTVAAAAYRQVLWPYGPRRRADLAAAMLDAMLAPAPVAARSSALQMRLHAAGAGPEMALPNAQVVAAADRLGSAEVTVVVPLHDYAAFIAETLDSVAAQTLATLDLVIVDDASTDGSLAIARDWVQRHGARFNRVLLLRHAVNAGLGPTRNTAIDRAETPFVLPLDADDRLLPHACERLLATLRDSQADFAYPLVQQFGDGSDIMGRAPFGAQRLVGGNYITAIALITKPAWAAVGGYAHLAQGWEDFDFWCRCVEMGLWGQQRPEVLAEYRLHAGSMTRRTTSLPPNRQALLALMQQRHPWLSLPPAQPVAGPAPGTR